MTDPPTTEELLARGSYGPDDGDEVFDRLDLGDFYDKEGRPITMRQWGILHNCMKYLRIAETTIGPYWISTVWIGVNHGIFGPPPLIFETMVFNRDSGESDLDCRRYSTLDQALDGHARMVEEVRLIESIEQ